METERLVRIGLLFDFYGALLTEKQSAVIQWYCLDNLSLGEISEQVGSTRQAVYDLVQRSVDLLEQYDRKLNLLASYHQRQKQVGQAAEIACSIRRNTESGDPAISSQWDQLEKILAILQED